MLLSEICRMATENLQNVAAHYPYVEIPLFVVMPNHIHAIVIIDESITKCVETLRATYLCGMNHISDIKNGRGLLSVVVGGLKSVITKISNQQKIPFAWQSRFYDYIICNHNELNRIVEYIKNYIDNRQTDKLNKSE